MLECLHIENIAVVEQANLDFLTGFNVMTGETGAGKSIIIDALFALMGERTSRELIRHGCDKAVVSACFSSVGKAAENKLSELGYSLEDGKLIIQRVLFADGRGQVKINSAPANVSTLKELGKCLINIHGQHDSQNLLNPEKHIGFIDAYAENTKEKNDYIIVFENFKKVSKELTAATENEQENENRAETLKYQIKEIENADVKLGEAEALKEFLKNQQNCENISQGLKTALGAIGAAGADDVFSALDLLNTAKQSLEKLASVLPDVVKSIESLDTAILESEAAFYGTEKLLGEVEYNPQKIEECERRLDILRNLMLKYGGSEQSVIDTYNSAKSELETINTDNKRKNELEEMIIVCEKELIDKGNILTETRKKAAAEIEKRISSELEFLDFSSARFEAPVKKGRYTKNGCDVVEFLISANAGEAPKPLAKIASGGELSRIMLAIRNILSLKDDVGTLIFDEIDTGISGHAAGKVGVKLYEVSKKRQVICVTHLAQIASYADLHLFISKSVKDNKTYTVITPLDYNGRVKEIARIISGGQYTESLMKTAEEMIKFCKN